MHMHWLVIKNIFSQYFPLHIMMVMVMMVVASAIHVNDILKKKKKKWFSTVAHCHKIYLSILGLQAKLGSQIPVSLLLFALHCGSVSVCARMYVWACNGHFMSVSVHVGERSWPLCLTLLVEWTLSRMINWKFRKISVRISEPSKEKIGNIV